MRRSDYLVAIDIGNTNVTLGLFQEGVSRPLESAHFLTQKGLTHDDWMVKYEVLRTRWGLKQISREDVVVASVVPELNYEIRHMFEKYYEREPVFLQSLDVPLEIHYDYPREIGIDRLVNVYAVAKEYPGRDALVIDFGTATTIDILKGGTSYEGGVIIPGMLTSLRALTERASKLPHIELLLPSTIVTKNTVDGIRSGILHGHGAMIDELVSRITVELGWENPLVIATGGLSKVIKQTSHRVNIVDTHLMLKGIYYLWMNDA
ncbi:type III pantothenate kinase [Thermospira aquatica]|uniref:Type III pantothenate kinase n=1 Tax=Thermospira aquatica TaxID=2828656 RepID=A0AAX3BE43_9SPIR|nr:type III pantothenate kinase [Thermospira aquatica]URA10006.1 type III pantothenate kinase [Thermospira aquatica]